MLRRSRRRSRLRRAGERNTGAPSSKCVLTAGVVRVMLPLALPRRSSTMVDRTARDKLAESLRHFFAGQITADKFLDAFSFGSCDAGVRAVSEYGDRFISELGPGSAVTAEERRTAARAIVFLHSDLEYEWPPFAD